MEMSNTSWLQEAGPAEVTAEAGPAELSTVHRKLSRHKDIQLLLVAAGLHRVIILIMQERILLSARHLQSLLVVVAEAVADRT